MAARGERQTRAEKAAATRAQLILAARRLFVENGYHATGTPELVASAGVTRGALYHHFRDKEDLFEAAFREVAKELENAARDSVIDITTDQWKQFQEGLKSFLALVSENAEAQRILLLDGPVVFGWSKWREIESEYTLVYIIQSLEEMMAQGLIEHRPAGPMAHLVLAALNDAALSIANADRPLEALPVHADALRALIAGLKI